MYRLKFLEGLLKVSKMHAFHWRIPDRFSKHPVLKPVIITQKYISCTIKKRETDLGGYR